MKLKLRQFMLLSLLGVARAFAADAPSGEPAVELPKPGPGQIGEEANYIVGPGDTIQVFVWRNPELSVTLPVRPDGKISTPLVEDVVAVGQTPSGLARLIEARLAEYIRTPQVNIIVTNAQSQFSKVTVIGQVKSPQAVPYRQGMTVLDVVLAVGGLGEFAGGNRAKLIRKDAQGNQKEIRVKLGDLVNRGRIKYNINMQPGDVLMVPESRF
jgi:polysaccharide biosynthesis/export protein